MSCKEGTFWPLQPQGACLEGTSAWWNLQLVDWNHGIDKTENQHLVEVLLSNILQLYTRLKLHIEPENQPLGKAFWKPSFSGSMLYFRGGTSCTNREKSMVLEYSPPFSLAFLPKKINLPWHEWSNFFPACQWLGLSHYSFRILRASWDGGAGPEINKEYQETNFRIISMEFPGSLSRW